MSWRIGKALRIFWRQGGSNLQDEFSTNFDFADFFRGSPGFTYSKRQLDAPIYWRSYSWEEHFVSSVSICQDIAVGNGNLIQDIFLNYVLFSEMKREKRGEDNRGLEVGEDGAESNRYTTMFRYYYSKLSEANYTWNSLQPPSCFLWWHWL